MAKNNYFAMRLSDEHMATVERLAQSLGGSKTRAIEKLISLAVVPDPPQFRLRNEQQKSAGQVSQTPGAFSK